MIVLKLSGIFSAMGINGLKKVKLPNNNYPVTFL